MILKVVTVLNVIVLVLQSLAIFVLPTDSDIRILTNLVLCLVTVVLSSISIHRLRRDRRLDDVRHRLRSEEWIK